VRPMKPRQSPCSDPAPVPICPRCCSAPLRFVASGDCSDSTGGGVYACVCGYSTARDELVASLLAQLRDLGDLFERFAMLALLRLTRCATGRCKGVRDPALDTLRDLFELIGEPLDPPHRSRPTP
jgi:hypothetical protein